MSTTEVFAGNETWVAGADPAAGADARGRTPVSRICAVEGARGCAPPPPVRRCSPTAAMTTSTIRVDPIAASGTQDR